MKGETGYRTRQRDEIIAYLESTQGQHVTAKSVHTALAEAGSGIGAATVYRQLVRLEEEGLVRRYTLGQGEAACYEYVGDASACKKESCFHCLCTECGKLYHMECEHLAGIAEHLSSEHAFRIDPSRTVFYGICDACSEKDASHMRS